MDNQTLQHVKTLFKQLENPDITETPTPMLFYVEREIYYKFKICCYSQNIGPHDAMRKYMMSVSSKQTVDCIKKALGGKG